MRYGLAPSRSPQECARRLRPLPLLLRAARPVRGTRPDPRQAEAQIAGSAVPHRQPRCWLQTPPRRLKHVSRSSWRCSGGRARCARPLPARCAPVTSLPYKATLGGAMETRKSGGGFASTPPQRKALVHAEALLAAARRCCSPAGRRRTPGGEPAPTASRGRAGRRD